MHPRIQEVLEYLDATRSELGRAMEAISPPRREERPAPDRWSVAEVLDHLTLVESRISRVMSSKIGAAKAEGLGPEIETSSILDSINRARITDRSRRVTAPEPINPKSQCNSASAWSALQQSRAELRAVVLAADGLALGEVMHPHPVLGVINLYQWIVFVGSHEARHTDQIREIATDFAARSGSSATAL